MEDWNREARAAREDERELEALIEKSKQFILYQSFKAVHHFVTTSDDEWSVGLIAFSEAVQTWDEEKGPFKPFAGLVIRRRLTDYMQSEGRHAAEIAVEPYALSGEYGEDEESVNSEVRRQSLEFAGYADEDATPGTSAAADEIAAVQQTLAPYGFSFFDLTDCSPKAEKTKRACTSAVKALFMPPPLVEAMRGDHSLPIKQIVERAGVDRKIIERHRRYIIAAAEILDGDYPVLASYMAQIREAIRGQEVTENNTTREQETVSA